LQTLMGLTLEIFTSNTEQLMKYIDVHLVPLVFKISILQKTRRINFQSQIEILFSMSVKKTLE